MRPSSRSSVPNGCARNAATSSHAARQTSRQGPGVNRMTDAIIAVLEHYGAVSVPHGTGWRSMRCPFHQDSVKSGSIHAERGIFNCHACHMSGDAVTLIRKHEHMDRSAALEFSRSVLGQSIEDIPRAVPERSRFKPLGNKRWKKILE